MADNAPEPSEIAKIFKKPLTRVLLEAFIHQKVDMTQEMPTEATEIVTSALDKYFSTQNWEVLFIF